MAHWRGCSFVVRNLASDRLARPDLRLGMNLRTGISVLVRRGGRQWPTGTTLTGAATISHDHGRAASASPESTRWPRYLIPRSSCPSSTCASASMRCSGCAPAFLVARMLGNVAIDGVVGAVPLVGDVFDVMWRSNRRNMRLLQDWLAAEEGRWQEFANVTLPNAV